MALVAEKLFGRIRGSAVDYVNYSALFWCASTPLNTRLLLASQE
jgi:hypothetical protein